MRTITGLADGSTLHCRHVGLDTPVPSVIIPWARTMDCHPCAMQRALTGEPELTEREKYTCDICRRYEPGLMVWENYVRCGPALVYVACCDSCNAKATRR
jgi:hypothetical protein